MLTGIVLLYWFDKLSGSILEDTWKEKGQSDMDEVIKRIEDIVLDAKCSRWVSESGNGSVTFDCFGKCLGNVPVIIDN